MGEEGGSCISQDGSREFLTVMACCCADGSSLPPALIYAAKKGAIQSSWVEDIKAGEHKVFVSLSPTGWSNDNVGLAWLEQVFDRYTKQRSGRWRLLILDGHGSHVTMDFIDYCDRHRILLIILPPIQPTRSSRSMWCCLSHFLKPTPMSSPTISIRRKALL
ncbi:hypothetical protein P3342_004378 [Pyrenophora teres f. teres]|nr:hypothetical protein P3342_004378 [Pyrenophora teres f. teres]